MSNDLHFAVAVGINNYPELTSLHSAGNDAHSFAQWLRSPDGGDLPIENVEEITLPSSIPVSNDRYMAKPDRDQVLRSVYQFMKKAEDHVKQNPQDWDQTRFYFYASGHGIAPESADAALLMANAGPDWYGENIPCSGLLEHFEKRQPFKEIVIFADCCREYLPEAPLGVIPWSRTRRDNGHVVDCRGFASYFGDFAYEPDPDLPPDQRRGYFTAALLDGLKKAVNPKLNVVDSNSLAEYVTRAVAQATAHLPRPQKPQIIAEPGNPLIFGKVRQPSTLTKPTATVSFTTTTGDARIINGTLTTVGNWSIANGDWEIPLDNGMYRVVVVTDGVERQVNFDIMGENAYVTI